MGLRDHFPILGPSDLVELVILLVADLHRTNDLHNVLAAYFKQCFTVDAFRIGRHGSFRPGLRRDIKSNVADRIRRGHPELGEDHLRKRWLLPSVEVAMDTAQRSTGPEVVLPMSDDWARFCDDR